MQRRNETAGIPDSLPRQQDKVGTGTLSGGGMALMAVEKALCI
jgi:hypothetical protein